ncbi:MAG: hypothetical protein IPN19_04895, partial [Elusimicrobia bacterium]|nr:hypothetical protein [Elusimicrobiota bacterium]
TGPDAYRRDAAAWARAVERLGARAKFCWIQHGRRRNQAGYDTALVSAVSRAVGAGDRPGRRRKKPPTF